MTIDTTLILEIHLLVVLYLIMLSITKPSFNTEQFTLVFIKVFILSVYGMIINRCV